MTPSAALDSDVFRLYVLITAAAVLGGGIALAVGRWGLRRDIRSLWSTYVGWLVIIPLVIGAVFLGRVATIVFVTLVALLGMREFARATGLFRDGWMTGAALLGVVAAGVTCLVPDPVTGAPGWYGLFVVLPAYVIAVTLMIPIVRNRSTGQFQSVALAIVGFVYVGWMFEHLAFLANAQHAYGYLMYLIFAVEIGDISAYVFGRTFGRHPLRSNISPGKTWGGAAGALAVSMALPWVLRFSFPHFGPLDLIAVGLIVGIGGQAGDLSISVIKRDVGIKDMGTLIRGHGGVLDRIDSLIFVAPFFLHYTRFVHGL